MTEVRRWYCHTGAYIEMPADTPLTMKGRYDRLTHRIWPDGLDGTSQVYTACGRRGCGGEIPASGPVDCPECVENTPGPA